MRRAALIVCLGCLTLFTLGAGSAFAQQAVSSSGPINNIWLTDDLGCQATHVGDTNNEFFGGANPGACGTFLVVPGVGLYGPSVPGGLSPTDFAPVSQSGVIGAGTASSPYEVVTQVGVPGTDVGITQTDSYVVGQDYYRTDITVINFSSSPLVDATLYHAGDCYLQGSDAGYGWLDPTGGGIYCSANPNNSPSGRIVGFQPLTGGNNFVEGYYATIWGDMTPLGFPDTCDCTTFEDNAAGLSWTGSLPPGTYSTVSLLTIMSPAGTTTTTTAPTSSPGQTTGTGLTAAAQPGQPAGTPVLGRSFNATPVSGQVYVKVPGSGFAPLTGSRQLPVGSQVDTLSGKVELTSATGEKGKRAKRLQDGTFNGAIFSVAQAHSGRSKGLVTLKLLDASCRATNAEAGPLARAAVSSSVLSTLHARSHGKYSSSGHYGSATSRGTAWTITDRCDSTLITVQQDTVLVHDFVHHTTITLHAGQRYLIRAGRR